MDWIHSPLFLMLRLWAQFLGCFWFSKWKQESRSFLYRPGKALATLLPASPPRSFTSPRTARGRQCFPTGPARPQRELVLSLTHPALSELHWASVPGHEDTVDPGQHWRLEPPHCAKETQLMSSRSFHASGEAGTHPMSSHKVWIFLSVLCICCNQIIKSICQGIFSRLHEQHLSWDLKHEKDLIRKRRWRKALWGGIALRKTHIVKGENCSGRPKGRVGGTVWVLGAGGWQDLGWTRLPWWCR